MKQILLYILLIASFNSNAQLLLLKGRAAKSDTVAAGYNNLPPGSPILILTTGESNSGGYALNSDATTLELSSRPEVQILNNNTFSLENLDIGYNNLIGHQGFSDSDKVQRHGIELELANLVADSTLPNPIYLVKTGMGGSIIENWAVGGTYQGVNCWQTFMDRVDSAISKIVQLTGMQPRIFMYYSQGINNTLQTSDDPATWRVLTEQHLDKIDARYGAYGWNGKLPKFVTNFYTSVGDQKYNSAISQLCADRPEAYLLDTNGIPQYDSHHWSYAGNKTICQNFITLLKANYSL